MSQAKKHKHKDTYFNDIALRLGHNLLGLEHLHYGYFRKGLKPDWKSLPAAQDAYVKNLISWIPKDVKKIFDVGCGTGGVAKELVKKKYSLTCLAPDPYLIEKTLENTGRKVKTITDLYENVQDQSPESFDLVLMSESCQYIKIQEGWEQNQKYLRNGGYVLVADFFRIREPDRPGISKSGHPLEEYLNEAKKNGFKLLKKEDITSSVAPTMILYQELILEKVFPVVEALFEVVKRKYPKIYKILRYFMGDKILRLKEKYSNQGPDIFKKYKAYYVLLFQKTAK